MMLRRDPTKALQVGFLAVLLICMAQVAWWIGDQASYAGAFRDRVERLYESDARAVSSLLAGTGAADSAEELAALLPHLDIDRGSATVHPAAIEELESDTSSRINRYAWEGGFFLLVLIVGMAVLTRTIRHDAELRRRQQNFLAAVSHEFKSPLASMRLASETLLMRTEDRDTRRLAHRLLEDGERLLTMVDNLLDTARLEEGRLVLRPEPLLLAPVAEACAAELTERAQLNDIDIRLQVADDLTVHADRAALETVLRNLLDNAMKACIAGQGRLITLSASRAADRVHIEVGDDGLGFPPKDAAMMFEKFYRLGDELRRSTPGTGLGLYIVRKLADLSDAGISAASEGPGKGATVRLSWPGAADS